MADVRLLHGDMREQLRELPASSVDACVTDPPYELDFMNNAWDASGVSFQPRTWRAVYRVLKPGAHVLAFGGTRTYHRIAVAIEDAGFELRDTLCWLHGNGFPKSLNAEKTLAGRNDALAGALKGYGTALKPAFEPIIMARKPLTGTLAENAVRFGTGAINIDGCRIATAPDATPGADDTPDGRFPANVVISCECDEHHQPDCPITLLDEQAGQRGGGIGTAWGGSRNHVLHAAGKRSLDKDVGRAFGYGDTGGPSRFFYQAKATYAERNRGLDGWEKKANRINAPRKSEAEKFATLKANHHPTVKPVKLMDWLVKLVAPPGGTVLDPFSGSGTTGMAAVANGLSFIGCEQDPEFWEIAAARIAWAAQHGID